MNTTVDGVLSIVFAVAIIVVIVDAARIWYGLIFSGKEYELSEAAYEESHLASDGREIRDREPVGAGS